MRLFFVAGLVCFLNAAFADDFDRNQIKARIKPVGSVRIEGQAPTVAEKKQQSVPQQEKSKGEQIYAKYCAVCHKTGLAGAPKFRDEKTWRSRSKVKDLDALTQSAIKGMNAMPAKGTCMECNEADIKKAVSYMLPQ
jgi:cytochrome c5